MTGNTDRDNEIWLEAYMTTLKGVADESLGHLAVRSKTPADTAEIDRRARAIYNLARAARMVAAARRKPGTRVEDREDEMRDDDDPDESRAEAPRADRRIPAIPSRACASLGGARMPGCRP